MKVKELVFIIDDKLEGLYQSCGFPYELWELALEDSILTVNCSKTHDNYMFSMVDHIKKEGNSQLLCVLAEENAANVIGIDRPDLLVVSNGRGMFSTNYRVHLIEAQNGGGIDHLIKKTVRYSLAADEFSIVMSRDSVSHLQSEWDRIIKLELEKAVYQDHLHMLGFVEEEKVERKKGSKNSSKKMSNWCFTPSGEVRGTYKLNNKKISVYISMSNIAEVVDISLYQIVKDDPNGELSIAKI